MEKKKPQGELEFFRHIWPDSGETRDWSERWKIAGDKVDWEKAKKDKMVADASSPIWGILSAIWPDSTGSEIPPFAYGSGMAIKDRIGHIYYDSDSKDKRKDKEDEVDENDLDIDSIADEILPKKALRIIWG